VTLLHVVEVIPGLPMEEEGTFYGRLERPARANSSNSARSLEDASFLDVEVRSANRAAETVRYARNGGRPAHRDRAAVDPAHPAAGVQSMSFTVGNVVAVPGSGRQ